MKKVTAFMLGVVKILNNESYKIDNFNYYLLSYQNTGTERLFRVFSFINSV